MKYLIYLFTVILIVNSCSETAVEPQEADTGFTTTNLDTKYEPRRIFFINENTGWIITSWSVLRTTDGGETWSEHEFDLQVMKNPVSVYFLDSLNGFVGTTLGIFMKTTDGGLTWNDLIRIDDDFEEFDAKYNINGIHFHDVNTGFLAMSLHVEYCSIAKTTDGGQSWQQWKMEVDTAFHTIALTDIRFVSRTTGFCTGYQYNNDYGHAFLLKTTDEGETWQEIDTKDSSRAYRQICFVNENTGWIHNGEYILKTTDQGDTWIRQNPGQSEEILRFTFSDENHGWLIQSLPNGMYGGNRYNVMMKTMNGGQSWHYLLRDTHLNEEGGILRMKDIFFTNNNTGWAIDRDLRLLKTINGGELKYLED